VYHIHEKNLFLNISHKAVKCIINNQNFASMHNNSIFVKLIVLIFQDALFFSLV